MFYADDWDYNIKEGEFSTEGNGVDLILSFQGTEFPVKGWNAQGWNRKEVDGRLVTETPLCVKSVTLTEADLVAVPRESYAAIEFLINGERYKVSNYIGVDVVRFFLVGTTEQETQKPFGTFIEE